MVYGPHWKGIIASMECPHLTTSPNVKAWCYENCFSKWKSSRENITKYIIKDTISINISSMYYMKWTRIILPVVFEEFGMVYRFVATFFFLLSLSVGKRWILVKIKGSCSNPLAPRFLQDCLCYHEELRDFSKRSLRTFISCMTSFQQYEGFFFYKLTKFCCLEWQKQSLSGVL